MEKRTYKSHEEALAVAKEAIWLAWNAVGSPGGMGWLQNKPDAKKDQVWDQAYEKRDYSGRHPGMNEGDVHADYVFGRMMKLYFQIDGDTLEIPDHEPRGDYQAWCFEYPTYAALFDAAAERVHAAQSQAA